MYEITQYLTKTTLYNNFSSSLVKLVIVFMDSLRNMINFEIQNSCSSERHIKLNFPRIPSWLFNERRKFSACSYKLEIYILKYITLYVHVWKEPPYKRRALRLAKTNFRESFDFLCVVLYTYERFHLITPDFPFTSS